MKLYSINCIEKNLTQFVLYEYFPLGKITIEVFLGEKLCMGSWRWMVIQKKEKKNMKRFNLPALSVWYIIEEVEGESHKIIISHHFVVGDTLNVCSERDSYGR